MLVTYAEDGGYNHPDHVRTHLVASAAFQDAGTPERFPAAGAAWQPQKFYGVGFSRRSMRALWQAVRERGLPQPFGREASEDPPDWGAPDDRLTAAIDVAAYVPQAREALRRHRTQFDPDGPWMQLPDDLARIGFGTEHFILMRSLTHAAEHETDLFEGLRNGAS